MRERLLTRIAHLTVDRPRLVLAVAALVSLAAALALPRLHVTASRFALIAPTDAQERARTEAFVSRFGARADLVAEVRGAPEASRAACDALAERLAALDEAAMVLHRIETRPSSAALFLSLEDLEALAAMSSIEGPPRVASIVEQARRGLAGDPSETLDTLQAEPEPTEGALRLLIRTLTELERWLEDPARDRVELVHAPRPGFPIDDVGYLVSRSGDARYVFLTPREATDRHAYVAPLTRRARAIGAEVADAHGVEVAFTGYPAIAADEIDAIRNGSFVTGLVAAALVMLLFALGFRSRGGIVVAGAPLGVGILWAFGAIAASVGELNLLTQVAAPVFAGLGIDFAIHLLAAYDGARREGDAHRAAVETAMRIAGKGILTGGLTTAGAFASLMLAEYDAFAQLGLTASVGLLLVMAAVLTLTPALLTIGEHRGWAWLKVGGARRPPLAASRRWITWLSALPTSHPKRTLMVALAVTIGLAAFARPLRFDADVEALMPANAESIVAGVRMVEGSAFSNEHLGATTRDLDSARRLTEALSALPSVGRVESAATLLPADAETKLRLLREARGREPRAAPAAELGPALTGLAAQARGAAGEVEATSAAAADRLRALASAAERASEALEAGDAGRVEAFDWQLGAGAERWREALVEEPRAPALDDLPDALRARLVADDGRFAVYAYPDGDVFSALDVFNADVRSVAPDAVGYPVQFASFLARMKSSLRDASLVALGLVLVILGVDFRRLRDALLSLVPVALGAAWLFGLMSAFGLDANLANVAAVPLILGIGVDDGVHLIHRVRERGEVRPALESVWAALALTTATTMAGFGTVGLAPHRGMQSFALVMVLGSAACLLATLFVLPALLALTQGRSESSSTRPTTGIH